MTVSTESSSETFLGNGATTAFSFSFIGVDADDIEVIYTDSSGTESTLSPTVYTLVLNAPAVGQLWGIGGTVTYPISGTPIQTGTQLTVNRIVPLTQTVSIANQGAFYPQAVEQALDLLELQLQQVNNVQSYSLKTPFVDASPPTTLPVAADRANGYLGFDDTGQPIIVPTALSAPVVAATPRVVLSTTTNNVDLTTADQYSGIAIYQSGSSVVSVQLPTSGGPYPVFDASGNASTKNITVLPPAGLHIKGATTYVISSDYGAGQFYLDGTSVLLLKGA